MIAIIVGGAQSVAEEFVAAHDVLAGREAVYFVINDQIAEFAHSAIGVTLHPDRLPSWLRQRVNKQYPPLSRIWCHREALWVTDTAGDWLGSSGLFAVKIALECGFDRIILCGVPMSASAGHFVRKHYWTACRFFRLPWIEHRAELAPNVRSMSGWTRELFGLPTTDWLNVRT